MPVGWGRLPKHLRHNLAPPARLPGVQRQSGLSDVFLCERRSGIVQVQHFIFLDSGL